MPYRWPTDPPGKSRHSISWAAHQKHLQVQGTSNVTGGGLSANRVAGTKQNPVTPGKIAAPPPVDPALLAQTSANNQRRTNLLSDANVDLTETSNQMGFQYNPATGAVGGFDPTNPFSQAALLMQARKNRDQGENTGFASSGQLYSGAYNTAKTETGYQYDKGYNALRTSFLDYVKMYQRRKRDIQTQPIEELANL